MAFSYSPRSLTSPLSLRFLHGARSTAASPLQASFLTLRSPAGGRFDNGDDADDGDDYSSSVSGTADDDDSSSASNTTHNHTPPLGVLSAVNIIVGRTMGVGAYSVPAAVLAGVGSVGGALALWVAGAAVAFCGLAVYVELGTALPRSGGERVYLERMFRRPAMLATCMFMAHVVLLGFSAPNALVLGGYVLRVGGAGGADKAPGGPGAVRAIAVAAVTAICALHARRPRLGLALVNVLGVAKLVLLGGVVVGGVAASRQTQTRNSALAGHGRDPDMAVAVANFAHPWAGASTAPYDYATALLKVLYCFRGYSTANQVLSDVRDPVRTLRIAGPLALGLVALAYLAINVAFFLVVDAAALRTAGVDAAALFFESVFGGALGARVLPLVVVVSAAGNIAATAFAQARVNEALAEDGLLPGGHLWVTASSRGGGGSRAGSAGFASVGTTTTTTTTTTPTRGLLLHWLVSVAVIVLPPPGRLYNFLVDLGAYPVSVLSVALAAGLLALRAHPATTAWASPAPAPLPAILVFLAANGLLLVLPWLPPADGRGESDRFASYAYPAGGLAVLASGALYWCWWRAWQQRQPEFSGSSGSSGSRLGRRPRIRLSLASLEGWDRDRDRDRDRDVRDARDVHRRRAPCGCLTIH